MAGDGGKLVFFRLPSGEENCVFLRDQPYPNQGSTSIDQELALNKQELQKLLGFAKRRDPHVELFDIQFTVVRDDVLIEYAVGRDGIPVSLQVPIIKNLKKPDPTIVLDRKGEVDMARSCDRVPTSFELRPNYEKGESSSSHPRCVMCLDGEFIELVKNRNEEGLGCGHLYCADCLRSYLGKEMNEHFTPVMCPEKKCNQVVMIVDLWGMIGGPDDVMDRWRSAVQESMILMNPEEIVCPFEDCSAKFQDDGRHFLIRACPHCWKIFCMDCRTSWHLGKSCEEAQSVRSPMNTSPSD